MMQICMFPVYHKPAMPWQNQNVLKQHCQIAHFVVSGVFSYQVLICCSPKYELIRVTINSVVESEETINNKQLHLCECVYRFPGCNTRSPLIKLRHALPSAVEQLLCGCQGPRFHGWMSEPENPAVLTQDHAGTSPAFRGDTVKQVICQKQSVCYLLH